MEHFFVFRAQGQIVGSYLEIEDMIPDDYREYICKVSNGASENMILPAHIYQQGIILKRLLTKDY